MCPGPNEQKIPSGAEVAEGVLHWCKSSWKVSFEISSCTGSNLARKRNYERTTNLKFDALFRCFIQLYLVYFPSRSQSDTPNFNFAARTT